MSITKFLKKNPFYAPGVATGAGGDVGRQRRCR